MSQKQFPSSRGRERRHGGGKAHSFDMGYSAGSTVDSKLDRFFYEFWEGTERSKILTARRYRNKLLDDAERRTAADYLEHGDTVSAEDSKE